MYRNLAHIQYTVCTLLLTVKDIPVTIYLRNNMSL